MKECHQPPHRVEAQSDDFKSLLLATIHVSENAFVHLSKSPWIGIMASTVDDDVHDPFGLDESKLESEPLETTVPEPTPAIAESAQSQLASGVHSLVSTPDAEIALGTPEPAPSGLALEPATPLSLSPLPVHITEEVASSSEEEEEEWPEIPSLVLPTMFLPIPNVRFSCFSTTTLPHRISRPLPARSHTLP
jgi:hypothetical protein